MPYSHTLRSPGSLRFPTPGLVPDSVRPHGLVICLTQSSMYTLSTPSPLNPRFLRYNNHKNDYSQVVVWGIHSNSKDTYQFFFQLWLIWLLGSWSWLSKCLIIRQRVTRELVLIIQIIKPFNTHQQRPRNQTKKYLLLWTTDKGRGKENTNTWVYITC